VATKGSAIFSVGSVPTERIGLFALFVLFLFVPLSFAQERAPKAALESAVYDFGTVKKGAKLSQTISLRNTGDAPLIIERMTFPLPALTARVKHVVGPGEEASLALQVDTAALSGGVEGDIVVHSNDPQAPRLSLRVQGRVRSPVEVLPRPAIFLSAFRWEAETKKSVVTVVNRDESPLEILGNRTDGDRVTMELTVVESGQRYQLAVKLLPSAPAGPAGERITLSTNKGEIDIPVFTFLKEKVFANPPDVDLGRLSLEQLEKQPSLLDFRSETVFIYKYHGQDFRIRVESSLPFIGVEKTPGEGPGAVVNIPRQGPTGIFELRVVPIKERLERGKFQGTIRIFTNDAEFPELLIPVRVELE